MERVEQIGAALGHCDANKPIKLLLRVRSRKRYLSYCYHSIFIVY